MAAIGAEGFVERKGPGLPALAADEFWLGSERLAHGRAKLAHSGFWATKIFGT